MSAPSFAQVQESEQESAHATLLSAFTHDPVMRWFYPDTAHYRTHFPQLVVALGGRAFDEETAWSLDGGSAVALWLPPGTEADGDAIATVLLESVSAAQYDDLFSLHLQVDEAHPKYPHWYLAWLGVTMARQGTGLGGELMRHCLDIVDGSHQPAYLENSNPRNTPFYERHGFEVTGEAQAGTCPPVTFMLRAAR
jgi:GNAT superfamily N-acetyltransferase